MQDFYDPDDLPVVEYPPELRKPHWLKDNIRLFVAIVILFTVAFFSSGIAIAITIILFISWLFWKIIKSL